MVTLTRNTSVASKFVNKCKMLCILLPRFIRLFNSQVVFLFKLAIKLVNKDCTKKSKPSAPNGFQTEDETETDGIQRYTNAR